MQTQQENGQLKRTMKTRHLIMLSLGGVIGTGLFFNTGYIISTTGAAGTLLAYLIGALVVWLVMQCLGELSVAMPEMARSTFMPPVILVRRRATPWRGSTGSPGRWRSGRALPPPGSACSTGSRRCPSGRGAWSSAW